MVAAAVTNEPRVGLVVLVTFLFGSIVAIQATPRRLATVAVYVSLFAAFWLATPESLTLAWLPFSLDRDRADFSRALIATCLPAAAWVAVSGWNRYGSRWLMAATSLAFMGLVISQLSGEAGGPGWMFAFFRDSLGLSASAAEIATITVRKTIHLTFYGLMALLALIIGWRISLSRTRSLLFCMLWTLGHAAFDELRQSTTPNRTGTITDVLLDFAGVAVAITIWQRAFRRRIENAQEAL